MSSYYKTINGKHYDREMLDLADASVKKGRDGRISISDAKKIVSKASDAGKITETEARTLNYIHENYKFTKTASEYFKDFELPEKPAVTSDDMRSSAADNDIFGIKELLAKYYPLIILVILLFVLAYMNLDRLHVLFTKETAKVESVSRVVTETAVKEQPSETNMNEYTVVAKDTLESISIKLYGDSSKWKELYQRNKETLKSPALLYPGQKLKTDIQKNIVEKK